MVRTVPRDEGESGEDQAYVAERVGITLENNRTGEEVELNPSVGNTETKGTGDMVTYTDQCGHEEADQTGSGNAQHAIEGKFYDTVVRDIYRWYKDGDKVDITLPANIDTVSLFITDVTISQTQEDQVFVDANDGEERLVFPTQIQLKASGAIEEGATPQ